MNEITIHNSIGGVVELSMIKIDVGNIPSGDIPYYADVSESLCDTREISLTYINNEEARENYDSGDNSWLFVIGKRSGKLYRFRYTISAIINSDKLKRIKNEEFEGKGDYRFRNNISIGFKIIDQIMGRVINVK